MADSKRPDRFGQEAPHRVDPNRLFARNIVDCNPIGDIVRSTGRSRAEVCADFRRALDDQDYELTADLRRCMTTMWSQLAADQELARIQHKARGQS